MIKIYHYVYTYDYCLSILLWCDTSYDICLSLWYSMSIMIMYVYVYVVYDRWYLQVVIDVKDDWIMIKYDEGQYNIWNSKIFLRIFQVLTRIRPEFLSCLEFCLEFRSEFGYVWILIINQKVLCWIKFRTQFSKNKLSSTHGSRPKNPEWEQRYL